MIKMKCHKCGHLWDYKGKKVLNTKYHVYTSCSSCYTLVRLEERKDDIKEN